MLKFLLGLILAALTLLPAATTSAQTRNVTIQGDHGKLSAVLQTPKGTKKFPLVIICHGFTDSKNNPMLVALANDLEARGIASIRFDFNGHGDSEGDFQNMTVLNEIEDAKKVFAYARNLSGVTNIGIAGHSQGGVVTSMTAGQLGAENVKCIALLAPAAVLRDDAIRGNMFNDHYDAINPPEYVEIFNGKKLGRDYIVTAQTLPIYETAERFHGTALMIHGNADVIVPYTYSLHYQHIYPGSRLEILDGYDHGFSQDPNTPAQIAADYFAEELF